MSSPYHSLHTYRQGRPPSSFRCYSVGWIKGNFNVCINLTTGTTKLKEVIASIQILPLKRPTSGLNAEDKLKLVKKQATWVASRTSTIPFLPASSRIVSDSANAILSVRTFGISESSRGGEAVPLGFRSFSAISSLWSYGDSDEADDGVSQPQSPWV